LLHGPKRRSPDRRSAGALEVRKAKGEKTSHEEMQVLLVPINLRDTDWR
jgi:hypothetical protein